jgi:signal transduction histidine kinase
MAPASALAPQPAWRRLADGAIRTFHTYANWLVSISWKRFALLSVLLMIISGILQEIPPFNWRWTQVIDIPRANVPPVPPVPPLPPEARRREPLVKVEKPRPGHDKDGVEISIDERGVRITPRSKDAPASAASAAPAAPAASAQAASEPSAAASSSLPEVLVKLPPGADSDTVREAIEEAKAAIREAIDDANEAAREAARDAAEAARDAADVVPRVRVRRVALGDFLDELAMLWIVASAIIKITYKGRLQAEVRAAQATETAEAEQLKRQVVEARMAAMQAQVEPHFLFNTLASIDHLIETDPPRASTMQKNLIALLRASMPTMREANAQGGVRDLGREMAVIRPYIEILKVRMEERLQPEIDVPEGLHSAEFPPMMIQSLVENAIKHGLEPKPEGGKLTVRAQIVHGKLAVTVADTGLGFGRAATAGTGVGLANIRERLRLLYGNKASLTVGPNEPSGTVVTVTVPYAARTQDDAAAVAGAPA